MATSARSRRPPTHLDRDVARDTMPESEVAPHPEAQRQMLLDPVPLLHQTCFILHVVKCWKSRSMQGDRPGLVSSPPAIDDTGPTRRGV